MPFRKKRDLAARLLRAARERLDERRRAHLAGFRPKYDLFHNTSHF